MTPIRAGMTGVEAQAAGARILQAAGVANPRTDARILLAYAFGVSRDRLVLLGDQPLSSEVAKTYQTVIAQRAARVPVSYITGQREFFGRNFVVTPAVLDPRPDTETLVERALERPFERVLDLGTGSGCILLTLVAERPDARGLGTDISEAALAVARRNAERLRVADRASLSVSDWFQSVDGTFDLVVSNPPYIAASEMADLDPEVRENEPHLALTPGGDGLDAYRAIAVGLAKHLSPGGRVLLEIGPDQGAAVMALLADAGLRQIQVLPDLDGRDRVVEGFMVEE